MNERVQPVYLEDKLEEIREDGHLKYRSKSLPTWCPGCGYFSMADALTVALNRLGLDNKDVVVVSGIGCASRFPFFVNTYGFHTLHGRVLPVATGVKIGNDALTVIAVGGDGDAFAIGAGHLPHAARRNVDMTYLVFDNGIYGLTKGQTSPTSALGFKTSSTPYQNGDMPVNPLLMLLSYEATWVGQAYAGRPHHLADMITQAIEHKGFSFLRILSPCVTFDKTNNTYVNLGMKVRDLPEGHDRSDRLAAMARAMEEDHPALGVYFEEQRQTLGEVMQDAIDKAQGMNLAPKGV
ncbi:2-oxoacid:ferredoxin oxidoreductase subunit beta [Jhaorihella thermophila]|uniref:2-oxoglutarate ferredoxin oxidoreductase subunit beta n=1 Tax=Jhaorihella thermophila TaxID=488547 RepID=A0A1H5TIB7_9RHOB|nr:2-oxoacid:ferredoxin oxidoreductase subunit beta [Jhaorihella thermophila]SEF62514.1 2-oxoglutarate ferredoxin oxidoreductase subunit beta [Jhaorihella thermophila]